VLVTLSGILLRESDMQDRLVDAALSQFPVIGDQLRANVQSLPDKGVALAIGIAGALWAGLAGIKAAQNAMDHVWDVPMKRQPSFPIAVLRAVLMLLTLGVFVLLASFLGGVAAGTEDAPVAVRLAGIAGTLLLNVSIFLVAYRVLTVEDVGWRDVFVGALFAGVAWTVLQALGGYVIGHRLESAKETYGFFAVVIGLLTWIYLGAQVTLLGAEMNVVRARRLWPRALDPDRLMEADERALRDHARVEERREEETVEVQFGDDGGGGAPQAGMPPPGTPRPDASATINGGRGTGPLLRSIAADISTLVSKQIELAKQEIGEMVGTRAKAIGVFGAAAVLGLFVIGFLGMAGAEALDLVLPRWAAMLIVAAVFGVLAAVAIVAARGWLRSSASTPELTQESLKEDVQWAKQQLKR
ncbi:MAG: ribonuclease, partial [Actinomycetia bacterium]|nr:ribonuclease [Actinomycetes bacterium]